jgi:hypothetical protein
MGGTCVLAGDGVMIGGQREAREAEEGGQGGNCEWPSLRNWGCSRG